jgi:hypothetical protein
MKKVLCLSLVLFSGSLLGQGLFEKAVSSDTGKTEKETSFEWNGFIRGVLYGGRLPDMEKGEIKSVYGESALKLRIRKPGLGDGYAEMRFRKGFEFGEAISELHLREAYVNIYAGPLDIRFGQQIVVWGRADGFNPTDNITPKNILIRSPDEDDRRLGNFLLKTTFNLSPLRIEAIWIPVFEPSVLPVQLIPFPEGTFLGDPDYPDLDLSNSGFGIKLDLGLPVFDGSVSYFYGFNPFPGIVAGDPVIRDLKLEIPIIPKSYRLNVLGADFSTTLGSVGLRGEFAFRSPYEDYQTSIHIPNPDLQAVLGLDKAFGDFSLILQYIGRYVTDFQELSVPTDPMMQLEYELESKSRMLASQQNEVSHSISFRPALFLLHETLTLEAAGIYNLTTEELLIRPKAVYNITDALTFTLGGEIYTGPDETLYGIMDQILSALFVECRISF